MNISSFDPYVTSNTRRQLQARPGWLCAICSLGRLAGADFLLVAAVADVDVEAGAGGVRFGICDSSSLARIEGEIGSLANAMESGVTVRTTIELSVPRRLVWLQKLTDTASERARIPVYREWIDPARFSPLSEEAALFRAALTQGRQREEFQRRQALALALRLPRWDIRDMKHRQDWPAWLPEWVREAVKEESRIWIERPNPPPVEAPVGG